MMPLYKFDLQRFANEADNKTAVRESLLPHLRMICNVANTPIFSGFISILENNRDTLDKIDKYISPIFDIVSVFYKKKYPSNAPVKIAEEAELFASTIAISSSLIDVCDRMAGNAFVDASKELGNIANEMLSVCDTLLGLQAKEGINLNKTEEPDDLFIPIITATISYGLATLSTFGEDGLTSEVQSDINKALVKLGGATLEALLTEVLDDADKFITPFGVADVGLSVLVGVLEGFNKYSTQIDYYRDDGLPEDIAKKEAILDAVSGGLHDAMSNYLHGVDDVAFEFGKALGDGCKWIGAFLSGNLDSFEFSNDDKNYVEWVREAAMRASYGTSSFDDEIEIDPANPKTYPTIYAQDGNDRIKNIYPNVTIYGGHGNDSISLYEGARANSVIGGADDDYIYIYDINNTVDGGSGNELFLIVGNKNEIHGADGTDVIFIQGGSNNTITSGAEDDLIILQSGAKNNIIEYSQGDGSDVIFGYDTSNLIKVKGGYSVYVSGNDKIIQVDKGGIIVKDAKNLTLNINTIDLEEGETLPEGSGEGFIPYTGGLVLAPRFQDLNEALRGTSTNDRIENTLSNIMIHSGDGDDIIINYGENVTINVGNGADKIYNYADDVKINGGNGNDYIYNEAARVTMNGNNGNDTVENLGNNSRIDGGDDMDSIKNSGESIDINSGGGKDRILNMASNVRAYSYLDDNYITNTEDNVTLEGSKDNDYIYNSGSSVSINAGEGNNSVSVDGSADGYQTIETGSSNDTVQVGDRDETEDQRYHNYIDAGDGNNYINNSNVELSTISAGSGNDTIITGGGYQHYAYDYYEHAQIEAGAGDNRITVNSSMTHGRIYAEAGNDLVSISGGGEYNIISISSGNDSVITDIDNSTINVGTGDNFVSLYSEGDSVIAGSGNDYVLIKYGGNMTSLGSGNNTLISDGRETVTAGNGVDKITVAGGNINVGGGKNNVFITYGGDTTIYAGADDDKINVADKAEETNEERYYNYIDAGDGNNFINNSNVELSTIFAGSGNDTIITGGGYQYYAYDYYEHAQIEAGTGDNRITVNSSMTHGRIYAEAGNDLVSISGGGEYNIISISSGNDSIIADIWDSTINVGAGKNFVSLSNGGNNIIAGSGNDYVTMTGNGNNMTLGSGNNTIQGIYGSCNINAGNGDDRVTVAGGNINVSGGANNVSLTHGTYATVIAGSDNDTINVADVGEQRYCNYIDIGDGNNFINNSNVELSTIFAGSGNDTIITGGGYQYYAYDYYEHAQIEAGTGDNRITVNSSMTHGRIYAEAGNDLVFISGDGSCNIISVGEGRNTIFTHHYYDTNYNEYNTIEAGTGSDLIYTSGNSSFINASSGRNLISLAGGYYNTIVTGKGNDTISLAADANNNVIIFGGGNDIVYGYNSGNTVKSVGELTARTVGTDVILTDGTSNMTLKGAKGKTINTATLSSNDGIYKILVADKTVGDTVLPITIIPDPKTSPVDIFNETGSTLITGTAYDDTISNIGKKVTINALAGNDYIDNTGANTSINAGNGSDTVDNQGAKITIVGGKGDDYVDNYGKNVSINGGANNDELNNYGNKATILGDAGNDIIRNWGDDNGYGSDVSISGGAGNDSIVNNGGEDVTISGGAGNDSIINSGANVVFNYAKGEGDDTISGFNETSTLSISGDNYSTAVSDSDIIVTVGEGKIILVGAASLASVNIDGEETFSNPVWTLKKTTATYGTSSKTLITVTGVKSLDGLSLKNKVVTVSKSSLNKMNVTISDGYTLVLGSDITRPADVATVYDAKTMTYTTAGKSDGYSLSSDKKSITYNSATSKEFKFSGIANGATASNFYISGNTVTIGKAAVQTNGTPVKLLNQSGYTLKLGKGMTEPTNVATAYDAKTMTYTAAGKSEGYSLSSDKKSITYNSATSKEFKFSGIANGATASNFYISGNTVTIGKAAVQTNGTPVKLLNQSGYTLKLGKGMEAPTNNAGTLKNGIYTFGGKSTGYILDTKNNTIKYSAATSATLELSGVKSAPTAPTDDTLTLNLANFDKNLSVTSNTGKYKFSIASGTYTGKTFTGSNSNDTISNAGANLIINSGNGNDSVISSGANIKIDSGNGNDYIKSTGTISTIFGGAGNDTMAGSSGADTLSGDAGNDILWGGKGNDSMKGGTGNDSLVGYDGDDRISGDAGNDTILGGNGNDFLYGGTDNDYLEGNASSDTLSGAAGNDTLWGGADNDTLTGGAGNDVFIYKPDEGTDHITDYASGDILQILRTDGTNGIYTKATFASNKLTLTINGGGSIIFDNVSAGDKININGTTRTIAGNTLK